MKLQGRRVGVALLRGGYLYEGNIDFRVFGGGGGGLFSIFPGNGGVNCGEAQETVRVKTLNLNGEKN